MNMTARVSNATSEGFERDERGFRTRRARVSNATTRVSNATTRVSNATTRTYARHLWPLPSPGYTNPTVRTFARRACPQPSRNPPSPRYANPTARTYARHACPQPSRDPLSPGYTNPTARTYARHACPQPPADTGTRQRRHMPTFTVVSAHQPSRGCRNATAKASAHLRHRFCPNLPAGTRTQRRGLIPTFAIVSGYTKDAIGIISTCSHMKTTAMFAVICPPTPSRGHSNATARDYSHPRRFFYLPRLFAAIRT